MNSGQACQPCRGSCSHIPGRGCFGDLPGDKIVVSPPSPIVEPLTSACFITDVFVVLLIMNTSMSPFAPESLVSRDGCSSPVPVQPAHLHTHQAESGAHLRDSRVRKRLYTVMPLCTPPHLRQSSDYAPLSALIVCKIIKEIERGAPLPGEARQLAHRVAHTRACSLHRSYTSSARS